MRLITRPTVLVETMTASRLRAGSCKQAMLLKMFQVEQTVYNPVPTEKHGNERRALVGSVCVEGKGLRCIVAMISVRDVRSQCTGSSAVLSKLWLEPATTLSTALAKSSLIREPTTSNGYIQKFEDIEIIALNIGQSCILFADGTRLVVVEMTPVSNVLGLVFFTIVPPYLRPMLSINAAKLLFLS
ncbi:hypothetical protein Tco_0368739 [Tanacetum coccineum]